MVKPAKIVKSQGKVFKGHSQYLLMSKWVRWDDEPESDTSEREQNYLGWECEPEYNMERKHERNYTVERRHEPEKEWDIRYCPSCGARIHREAEICPSCGVRIRQVHSGARKNPGLAAVFSFLFVGLGQIYNGQIGKGIVFFIAGIILTFTLFIMIGFILLPLFWIYNIYDAYNTAKKINTGEIVV